MGRSGMNGRAEFFAGGPLTGWHDVPDMSAVVYEMPRENLMAEFIDGDHAVAPIEKVTGTYTRRKLYGCGWRVVIPIWTEGPYPPRGTVMPGFVFGEVLECELVERA